MAVLNQTIDLALDYHADVTAKNFNADVFSFFGGIRPEYLSPFRANMEMLATQRLQGNPKPDNLAFIIYTGGGVVEVVE